MKPLRLLALPLLALALIAGAAPATAATVYKVGDTVENFTLVDRATGNPVHLTDFQGKIVVLDWFAWWCPFCQAAAPQLLSGIDQWYATRGGNPAGIPVIHVGVNLQPNQEAQTQNFVNRAQLELVLQDFNRALANRIAGSGQPIFAIINGVTNSTSHKPWELIYSRLGYGQTSFPLAEFRTAIDAVKAGPPPKPLAPMLSNPSYDPASGFHFLAKLEKGRAYRIESTTDFKTWKVEKSSIANSTEEMIHLEFTDPAPSRSLRVVIP